MQVEINSAHFFRLLLWNEYRFTERCKNSEVLYVIHKVPPNDYFLCNYRTYQDRKTDTDTMWIYSVRHLQHVDPMLGFYHHLHSQDTELINPSPRKHPSCCPLESWPFPTLLLSLTASNTNLFSVYL